MVQIKPHLIHEPSLIHGDWIKIEPTSLGCENDLIISLPLLFPKALEMASKKHLAKIEIEINPSWELAKKTLSDLGFLPILTEWTATTTTSKDITDYITRDYSNKVVGFDDLIPLLTQQMDYHHGLYPHYYHGHSTIDWRHYRREWQKDFANPNTIFYTYSPDNTVRGLILGCLKKDKYFIWELVVDESLRSHGIGSNLLKLFLHQTNQDPFIHRIFVETGWNQPAARLYQKFGFTPTHQAWYKNL